MPPIDSTMSRFITLGNAECNAVLALRLLGRGDPGAFVCNNGVNPLEGLVLNNPSNGEILRSFHEAAVRNALAHPAERHRLRACSPGSRSRADQGMGFAESGSWPVHINAELLVKLLVNSANTGLPLTCARGALGARAHPGGLRRVRDQHRSRRTTGSSTPRPRTAPTPSAPTAPASTSASSGRSSAPAPRATATPQACRCSTAAGWRR